jgi:nucleoid DNA-binding protein
MKQLPIKTCPACGGSWFREATLHVYWSKGNPYMTLEAYRANVMPMTVLICLCGTPFRQPLGGIRGGRTPNAEITKFMRSFDAVERRAKLCQDQGPVEQKVSEDLVRKDRLRELRRVATRAEKNIGRRLAPRENTEIKPGGHWRLSQREESTKSKGRDWLVRELQSKGLTFDEAKGVVAAMFDSIVDALKSGETVETPLGEFRVEKRTKAYHRIRLGKVQQLHRTPKKVVFKPR